MEFKVGDEVQHRVNNAGREKWHDAKVEEVNGKTAKIRFIDKPHIVKPVMVNSLRRKKND